MKENKYDNKDFFEKYSKMDRSVKGLAGAGEWHQLKQMIPNLQGKRVLDLGCGFGWHCQYAIEQGASEVTGVDISEKMLTVAKEKTDTKIEYIQSPLEDINFIENSYDVVLSSLVLHYIESFETICNKVFHVLAKDGVFVFSVEHPIFTAQGPEQWYCDEVGTKLHWPVDSYFLEGKRETVFLGEPVQKYHKTLTTFINTLIQSNFEITGVVEPSPDPRMLEMEGMRDELRRPMMLLISARKK